MKRSRVAVVVFVAMMVALTAYAGEVITQKASVVHRRTDCAAVNDVCPCAKEKLATEKDAAKAGAKPCDKCGGKAAQASKDSEIVVADRGKNDSNPERRGCCSHHGGVCGCSGGRAMCCDGKLSPTCGCD